MTLFSIISYYAYIPGGRLIFMILSCYHHMIIMRNTPLAIWTGETFWKLTLVSSQMQRIAERS